MNEFAFILATIFEVALLIGLVLYFVFQVYQLRYFRTAPYVSTRKQVIDQMLELAQIQQGTRVLELGSGKAVIAEAAARRGATVIGIESNPMLVWWSRRRLKKLDLAASITIQRGNFFHLPLPRETDVVFCYLLPESTTKLWPVLCAQLRPGTRLISNAFRVKGAESICVKNGIYLYEIPLS